MKEYDDSGIEVYHQVMKKHHRRVGNLGNFEKKINSILKAEATSGKRQVQEADAIVEANRKKETRRQGWIVESSKTKSIGLYI
jgi:hypothetical protein